MIFFQIDPHVAMEMHQLQTIAWWFVPIPKPHTICDSHVLFYSFNIRSLPLHKNDVFLDYNLKTTHILCLNETHFNTLMSNNTSLNIDTKTHSMISVNGQNGTKIIYDNFTTLSSHETFTSLGAYCNDIQWKYKKGCSCNNNIQTFNIILVNVLNSPSKVFGPNANFLSHDNNWWFQY